MFGTYLLSNASLNWLQNKKSADDLEGAHETGGEVRMWKTNSRETIDSRVGGGVLEEALSEGDQANGEADEESVP